MPKLNPKFLAANFFWKGELHPSNIFKGKLHPQILYFTTQTSSLKCLKGELHPSNIVNCNKVEVHDHPP